LIITLIISFFLFIVVLAIARIIRLKNSSILSRYCSGLLALLSVLPFVLVVYIAYYTIFSDAKNLQRTLKETVLYSREIIRLKSNKAVVHSINVPVSKIDIFLTPAVIDGSIIMHQALTTTDALLTYDADIAINASFFRPFKDNHIFDYYPHSGDAVEPIGLTFSKGKFYGLANNWPVFVIYNDGQIVIDSNVSRYSVGKMKSVQAILSGKSILIEAGEVINNNDKNLYPRTVLGLDKHSKTLWLFVVDGKQPFYSNGLSLDVLSEYMISKGVYNALELDGGGSATMAWVNSMNTIELLSQPSHTKIPNRQRPVANHLLIKIK